MWHFFNSLAWYQWPYESASESFVYPSPVLYGLHAQPPCVDQFRDPYHHHCSYPHVMRSYCQSFDHDTNSYPYYDVFDECYAKINAMIETLNE